MRIAHFLPAIADSRAVRALRSNWSRAALLGLPLIALVGCQPPAGEPAASAAPPAPPPVMPFPQAVSSAADKVFTAASAAAPGARHPIVIDPLIDGVTGAQSRATASIQSEITSLVQQRYPQFVVEPFTRTSLATQPFVLVGTFTPVNAQMKTEGSRDAYRFCLVMADLRSGKVVAKGVARAALNGVDDSPLPAFADSPAWTTDDATQAYVSTCQASKVGDPINKVYLDGIITAATVGQAIDAYDAGRYRDALSLYQDAAASPAGDQLRVYNGIYLSSFKLGERDLSPKFARLVDYGFRKNRLALKILFSPGTASFAPQSEFSSQYPSWLTQIARRSAAGNSCLDVVGNTSSTGPSALNQRLSEVRAERVKSYLDAAVPQISPRVFASGVGSNDMMIGTGRDDASDALDRRVDFKVRPSC
jgi:outer membrane protein OmpA-like peptidoglycan-associated protein